MSFERNCQNSTFRRLRLKNDGEKTQDKKRMNEKIEETKSSDVGFNIRDFMAIENITEDWFDYCQFWMIANRLIRSLEKCNYSAEMIQVSNKGTSDASTIN